MKTQRWGEGCLMCLRIGKEGGDLEEERGVTGVDQIGGRGREGGQFCIELCNALVRTEGFSLR